MAGNSYGTLFRLAWESLMELIYYIRNVKNQMMYSFCRVFLKENNRYTIGFIIPNTNQKSDDYSHIKDK
jgi:hypothetical protein